MTHSRIAAGLGEDFLARALGRTYRHAPGAVPGAADLLTWDALNTVVATHRLAPPRLRLSAEGEALPVHRYAVPQVTRRHSVWHRIHPAELHARLAEGASLVLDAVDELHPPAGALARGLERWLRTHVQVNAYASWTPVEGFGTHWDDHDVIVVQLAGAKHWRLYGPTRVAPMYRDTDLPEPPPTTPVADLVLNPGDVLYLPRGWWHAVTADQGEPSLHLTCGLTPHTGADLITWLADHLRTDTLVRTDLPVHASARDQAAHLESLSELVRTALADPTLLQQYAAARDYEDPGRMRPSLPHLDGPPADPHLAVQLTAARARLTRTGEGVVLTGVGTEWEFAPQTEPLLQRLLLGVPVTLAHLAAAAGLTVAQAACVVRELLHGQVVTLHEPTAPAGLREPDRNLFPAGEAAPW